MSQILDQIPAEDRDEFKRKGYTIGGMMVFPGKRVSGKMTINGARGCHPLIKDRFDLTVECIRRHYLNKSSPLSSCLARYEKFFDLFHDFRGYVEFFLLQDLVSEDFSGVNPFLPFNNFTTSPFPRNVDDYRTYRKRALDFIDARNRRILSY